MQVDEIATAEFIKDKKYLTFDLDKQEYALDIQFVTEIIGLQKITNLPDMPAYVRGVINLRGKVIPVIDIRIRFGLSEREYDERTCIIVIDIKDLTVGLIVDKVDEVIDLSDKQIEPPPKVRKGSESRFISGLGKYNEEVKIILDVDKLLYDEEKEQLNKAV